MLQLTSCSWCNSQYWQFSHTVCRVFKLTSFTVRVRQLGANVLPMGFVKYDWHTLQYCKGKEILRTNLTYLLSWLVTLTVLPVVFPTVSLLFFVEQGISLGILKSRTVFCFALLFDVCFPAVLKNQRNPFEFFFIWSGNYLFFFPASCLCSNSTGPTWDGRLF